METFDNSNQPEIIIDEGIRFLILSNGLRIPIYDYALYRAVGMLPANTPDFELTNEELQAQKDAVSYELERQTIDHYINSFSPSSYEDIESFLEEMQTYLENYMIDIGDVRIRLQNRLFGLLPQKFTTSDPGTYLLYQSVGLSPVWIGEGDAPIEDEG